MIPRKSNAVAITHFRPISLINYSYKIITKLLADRLTPIMNSLIDYTQTIYIKGRYIMDDVVCAHEILHTGRKKRIKGVLFKLNFEKGF